jgi:hypothetical protein
MTIWLRKYRFPDWLKEALNVARYAQEDYKRGEAFDVVLDEIERLTAFEERVNDLIASSPSGDYPPERPPPLTPEEQFRVDENSYLQRRARYESAWEDDAGGERQENADE